MARRRSTSTTRVPRRARRRRVSDEGWLLLIGLSVLAAVIAGVPARWWVMPVEPNLPRPMTMAQARASNAAVAILPGRRVRAEPYRFRGGPAARAQAIECLATAALYEAGDDRAGQKAVMQVILNRARARGFPATICGVVYQGYARATGCQFSFTCDGSVNRRPVHLGWASARRAARHALSGYVFADVGRATHYHADWIVPYWRDSLTKIARVGPHLFYVR